MIKLGASLAAIGYSDVLAERGLVATAVPNTVLSELTRLTNTTLTNLFASTQPPSSHEEAAQRIELATHGTLDQPTDHDRYMDSIINDLSKAVTQHIGFAKNVVAPIVKQYAENVIAALDANKIPDPTSLFNIEQMELPAVLRNDSFVDMLKRYEGKQPILPRAPLQLVKTRTPDELLALMHLGEHETDAQIDVWFSQRPEGFFKKIWDYFFSTETTAVSPWNFVPSATTIYEMANVGLATYLLGNRFYNGIEETANAVNLTTYKNTAAQIRDYGATLLASVIENMKLTERNNVFIISVQPETRTCQVSARLYNEWLSNGGTPEVLFGLIVSNRRAITTMAVDEIKTELLDEWKSYTVFHNAASNNARFDQFLSILDTEFVRLMATQTEEEKAFEVSHSTYRQSLQTYLKEELMALRAPDMLNIYKTARTIICCARFYYTEANRLLRSIEESSLLNPEINVREAALVATIEYVADYIAEQIQLKPH